MTQADQAPTPENTPLPAPTGQAKLPQPSTVSLWGYEIPAGPDDMTFGEMQLAYDAATTGQNMKDFGFIAEYLAEAITNRCNLSTPLTAYDIRRFRINPKELTPAFTALIKPFTDQLEQTSKEGNTAGRP